MTVATLESPESAAAARRLRSVLFGALAFFVLLAGFLSYCQREYFNADFVAYSTVAHRLLANPPSSVNGYWSPLFSWCMAPLLHFGVSDLIAGRAVLLVSGIGYLVSIHLLALRFAPSRRNARLAFVTAMDFCAALHAALWATYLLDPDLLANALVFSYLVLLTNPAFPRKPLQSLLAGLCAGFAYLAKGYMLPFLVLQLPVGILLLRRSAQCETQSANPEADGHWWRSFLLAALGLALVAGPWIGVLSAHYGRPTFSTAGSANHANVSPVNFGHDPLWKPKLEKDFILDPHYGPDWSPFQSSANFFHQLFLVFHNGTNLLSHAAAWFVMLTVAALYYLRARRSGAGSLDKAEAWRTAFLIGTGILYCSGYVMVNLEARYIVPTMAPLLCMASLMLVFAVQPRNEVGTKRAVMLGILMVAPFSMQDIYRVKNVIFRHSQSTRLAPFRQMAGELRQAGLPLGNFAANHYFFGLGVAYAADSIAAFSGQPQATEPAGRSRELEAAGVRTYIDFHQGIVAGSPLDGKWKKAPISSDSMDVYLFNQ